MKINKCGYIIGALMLVLGLHSCQKTETVDGGERYPILFGSAETRAGAGLDNLKKDGFKVYAYFEGNAGSSSFERNVTYSESQKVWGYKPLEYWIPSTTYYFKAFYPAAPTAGTLTVNNTTKEQNFTITGFDVKNHQEDILIASASCSVPAGGTSPASGSVVNLSFDHILANIEIKIKSAINGLTINKVSIDNTITKGGYSAETDVWTSTETGKIEYGSGISLTANADFKPVTGDGILVIPTSPAGKTLIIEASNNKRYEVNFPASPTWEKGTKYSYTLEIKQSNIIFNEPDVEEWDSENATGSVIIK